MTVKDFIRKDIDIDVRDDYDERCWIAFCGPCKLTECGKQEFYRAMDVNVHIDTNGFGGLPIAILEVDNEEDAQACKELFFSLAGYCGDSDYDKWFVEVD